MEPSPPTSSGHFARCSAQAVSDVDPVGGSPVSVSRYGRRERVSDTVLPNTMLGNMFDDLLGPEVRPRVQGGKPSDRAIQIDGDMHGRHGLKQGERVRLRAHIIQGTSAREEKALSVTLRVIPHIIPDFLKMGIEPELAASMLPKQGWVSSAAKQVPENQRFRRRCIDTVRTLNLTAR